MPLANQARPGIGICERLGQPQFMADTLAVRLEWLGCGEVVMSSPKREHALLKRRCVELLRQ